MSEETPLEEAVNEENVSAAEPAAAEPVAAEPVAETSPQSPGTPPPNNLVMAILVTILPTRFTVTFKKRN